MIIEQIVDIPVNHQLTIDVPQEVPAGRVELKLVISPKAEHAEERRIPLVSWLLGRRRERQTRALLRFYGCLKDSPAFADESVEIVPPGTGRMGRVGQAPGNRQNR